MLHALQFRRHPWGDWLNKHMTVSLVACAENHEDLPRKEVEQIDVVVRGVNGEEAGIAVALCLTEQRALSTVEMLLRKQCVQVAVLQLPAAKATILDAKAQGLLLRPVCT